METHTQAVGRRRRIGELESFPIMSGIQLCAGWVDVEVKWRTLRGGGEIFWDAIYIMASALWSVHLGLVMSTARIDNG